MLRILSWALALTLQPHDNREFSDRLVPKEWIGRAWGPEATKLRDEGVIPPIKLTPMMKRWDRWGRQNLKDGDVIFRLGDAKVLSGMFPISRFIAKVSGSRYSHTGIVAIENGEPWVYDMTSDGVRREPFYVFILDNIGAMGIKRVKAPYRNQVPAVLNFCRTTFNNQVPFDYDLGIDDKALYCVEMTEKAFRAGGLILSQPVRLGDMENLDQYPLQIRVLQYASAWVLSEPLTSENLVFFPGNERHGIWSSPILETVFTTPLSPWSEPDSGNASVATGL